MFLDDPTDVPAEVVDHLAEQLDIGDVSVLKAYGDAAAGRLRERRDPRPSRTPNRPAQPENTRLKERLAQSEQMIDSLTDLRTQALARLAAQHEEVFHLRQTTAAASRVARLPAARSSTTVIGTCS